MKSSNQMKKINLMILVEVYKNLIVPITMLIKLINFQVMSLDLVFKWLKMNNLQTMDFHNSKAYKNLSHNSLRSVLGVHLIFNKSRMIKAGVHLPSRKINHPIVHRKMKV